MVFIKLKSGRSSGQSFQQFCIKDRISIGPISSVISGLNGTDNLEATRVIISKNYKSIFCLAAAGTV